MSDEIKNQVQERLIEASISAQKELGISGPEFAMIALSVMINEAANLDPKSTQAYLRMMALQIGNKGTGAKRAVAGAKKATEALLNSANQERARLRRKAALAAQNR